MENSESGIHSFLSLAFEGVRIINRMSDDNLYKKHHPLQRTIRQVSNPFLDWLLPSLNADSVAIYTYSRKGILMKAAGAGNPYDFDIKYIETAHISKWINKQIVIGRIFISKQSDTIENEKIGYFAIYRNKPFSYQEYALLMELFQYYGDSIFKWKNTMLSKSASFLENKVNKFIVEKRKSGTIVSRTLASMHNAFYSCYALIGILENDVFFVEYLKKPSRPSSFCNIIANTSFPINSEMKDMIYRHSLFTTDISSLKEIISFVIDGSNYVAADFYAVLCPIKHDANPIALSIFLFHKNFVLDFEQVSFSIEKILNMISRHLGHIYQRRTGSMIVNPIFKHNDTRINPNDVFVIMPFSEPWSDRIWNRIIRPMLESMDLNPYRADDLFGRDVMEDVWISICVSKIIIADITGRNANVFYELGIAHTLGKDVVLITQNIHDIPFDLNRYRHIEYKDNLDGYEKLEQELRLTINGLL